MVLNFVYVINCSILVMALLLRAHNECREVLIEVAKGLWINLHVKRDEAQMLKKQKRWPSAQGSKTCDA
jgi:hypothetical protein